MTVTQRWQGSKLVESDSPTIESEYNVFGTNDEFVAQAQLDAAVSTIFGGLVKKSVSIDERLGDEAWLGSVTWGRFEPKEVGDSSFAFDTGGGTAHKTIGIQTRSSTPHPLLIPAAPDFEGAIGVTDTGVDGVDVVVPQYQFSETHFLDVATVSAAYKATVFALTGGVNDATFKGFAAGEVLFLGAAGTLRDYETWELSYKFAASPNATSFAVGPITVPLKYGWDYLWVRYREEEDATAGHLARRPIAAYVEEVYPAVDLSLLGI
jgi:hypothetical protein